MQGHDLKGTSHDCRDSDRARFIAKLLEVIFGGAMDPGPRAAAAGSSQEPVVLLEAELSGHTYRLIRVPPPISRKLSDRQLRVVDLVRAGLTKSQIASQLGIRPSTVCTHLARIYKKFRVHSIAQLLKRVSSR